MSNSDNNYFRQTITNFTDNAILALCETFLRNNEEIYIDGYKFIGHNRTKLHKNAKRGSGGICILFKCTILEEF